MNLHLLTTFFQNLVGKKNSLEIVYEAEKVRNLSQSQLLPELSKDIKNQFSSFLCFTCASQSTFESYNSAKKDYCKTHFIMPNVAIIDDEEALNNVVNF